MSDEEKEYGMFNGRRSADQYVKGYLKGILAIASIGLTIFVGSAGWLTLQVLEHQTRLTKIEASRFTVQDGAALLSKVNDNRILFSEIKSQLTYLSESVSELNRVIRRAAPAELKVYQP